MATESGESGTALVSFEDLSPEDQAHAIQFEQIRKMLDDEIFRIEFFQAVRLLERVEKDRQPVGYFFLPGDEVVRFSSLPTLAFAPSQLYDLRLDKSGRLTLVVQFMGLCSAMTVMPHIYTEQLMLQARNKDFAMAEFFDIFNHRMVSLFYRAWKKYRFFIGYESDAKAGLTPRLMDLLGLGTEGLAERSLPLPDRALLAHAGVLGRHVRTPAGLKQILEDYFGVTVVIHQFAGTWRVLPEEDLSRLEGKTRASELLGVGTVVGREVWDQQGRIRISIGPMSFEQYVNFLPGYSCHEDLAAWIRFYSLGQYEAEIQLLLHREEAPACELGLQGKAGPRLGFTSWLKTKPLQCDPGDAMFLLA